MYKNPILGVIFIVVTILLLQHQSQLDDSIVDQNERFAQCHFSNDTHCPSYFTWIKHDLAPWQRSGISRASLGAAKERASFRVVIVDGKLYVEQYRECYQTRAEYTIWGLRMLLEKFPGMVPDLELMFQCGDHPRISKLRYLFHTETPALFSYCTTQNEHYDIVFPDWAVWGWPEMNIAPWTLERDEIMSEANKLDWFQRQPIAQWRGNTVNGDTRKEMIKCNSTSFLVQHQDWDKEKERNYTSSHLSSQCMHRYKVYAEGYTWSVSLKYIMACGATMLRIEPRYGDFFSRSLIPYLHYVPVSKSDICPSIQEALRWGKTFPAEAAIVGQCGQNFLKEQLTVDYVYQYMLHILQAYAKLLTFKPVPPPGLQPFSLQSDFPWQNVAVMPESLESSDVCSL